MTTREFIEMLQKEDPSGDSHIRLDGHYCTFFAEQKPGYWDGPYSYLKGEWGKDMVWMHTSSDYKVDIHCVDVDRFIEYFDGDFEEVKKHLEFDYSNYCDKEHVKRREEGVLKQFKDSCDEYHQIREEIDRLHPKNK